MERQITDIITNLRNGKREEAYKLFKEYLLGLKEKKNLVPIVGPYLGVGLFMN